MEAFLETIWATTHHHVTGRSADYFDGLLRGPSALDELLRLFREDPEAVRLMRGADKKSGAEQGRVAAERTVPIERGVFGEGVLEAGRGGGRVPGVADVEGEEGSAAGEVGLEPGGEVGEDARADGLGGRRERRHGREDGSTRGAPGSARYGVGGVSAVSRASYFRAAFSSPILRAALSAARTSVRRSP